MGLPALAVLLAGCGGPVAPEDVEASIERFADDRGWALESADCPSEVPAEVGAIVMCAVEITGDVELESGEVGTVDRVRVVVRGVDRGTPRYSMYPLIEGATP